MHLPEITGYNVISKIGQGAMAEVFLAEKPGANHIAKKVVIKRILPHLNSDKEFVRLFTKEAKISINLQHPNLAQVYGFEKTDSQYLLIMEYVEGCSLNDLAKKEMPDQILTYIGIQILEALNYLHNHEEGTIIHRDLKPEHIIINDQGLVKLVDLGIAVKASGNNLATQTTARGNFKYASPEQKSGSAVDSSSDIFSLGLILLEHLTGFFNTPLQTQEQVSALLNSTKKLGREFWYKELANWLQFDQIKREHDTRKAKETLLNHLKETESKLKEKVGDFVCENRNKESDETKTKILDTHENTVKPNIKFVAIGALLVVISILAFVFTFFDQPMRDYPKVDMTNNFNELRKSHSIFSIVSNQDSEIFIDGKSYGKAPTNAVVLPGKHQVTAKQTPNNIQTKRTVYLVPGANPTQVFRFKKAKK